MADRRAELAAPRRALGGWACALAVLALVLGTSAAARSGSAGLICGTGAGIVGNDSPAWSRDGTKIAFVSFRHGCGQIYVMNPDGTGQRRLTSNSSHDDHPAWSPDGRRIAFTSARAGGRDIYVMNADGSRQTRLTDDPEYDFLPSWSPDGRKIAFRSNRDRNGEIYVINADGTGEVNVTRNSATDESPRWTPDGKILFASQRTPVGMARVFSLYVMNPDGTGIRKVTTAPSAYEDERGPDVSPDGRRIAFVSDRQTPIGNIEIYTVNADGTGMSRLTNYEGYDADPTWSPDGSRIAFTRGPDFASPEIYVMRADGTGLRQLTTTRLPATSAPTQRLSAVSLAFAPRTPKAGRSFAATVGLRGLTATEIGLGLVALECRARVGRAALRVLEETIAARRARCTWAIPTSARGKRLHGSVTVTVGDSRAARRFSLAVS